MGSRNGPQGICFVKKQLYPLRHLALLSHISIWKPPIRWLWWLIFIINLTIWNNLGKQNLEIFLWGGKSHTKCRKHHSTGWSFRLMIFFKKKKKGRGLLSDSIHIPLFPNIIYTVTSHPVLLRLGLLHHEGLQYPLKPWINTSLP